MSSTITGFFRENFAPRGFYGGQDGAPSESIWNPEIEDRHIMKITLRMENGDTYRLITAGAGGWGNPLERDPECVRWGMLNEKVSIRRAREIYGVVVN